MCSLGHHDHADTIRPTRRHTDGSVTAMVRKMPRAQLAAVRAAKTAELHAAVSAKEADALAEQHGAAGGQLELVPRDQQQVDDGAPRERDPRTWWRDRD